MYSLLPRNTLSGLSVWDIVNDDTDVLLTYDAWEEAKDMLEFLNSL